MNSSEVAFEIPELLTLILDFLPDIADCMYVNKLLTQIVIAHDDYKYVWSLAISKRYDGIVLYDRIKFIHTCEDMPHLLDTSAKLGNLRFIMYIRNNMQIDDRCLTTVHKTACEFNQLHIAEYLHEYRDKNTNDNLIWWCEHITDQPNFIFIYQYVTTRTNIKYFNTSGLILFKCMKGDLTFVKYVDATCVLRRVNLTNVLTNSVRSGNTCLLQYILNAGYDFDDKFTKYAKCAVRYDHLNVLDFLGSIQSIHNIRECLIKTAARYGQLNIIEALYTDSVDLHANPQIFIKAARAGHIAIVKFLLTQEPRLNAHIIHIIYDVFTFRYTELFEYLYEQLPDKQLLTIKDLKFATYVPFEDYQQMLQIITKH